MDLASISGVPASAAGVPGAQSGGTEIERAHIEHDRRRVEQQAERKAGAAAGAAASDDRDKTIGDREGDGRQAWVIIKRPNRSSGSSPPTDNASSRDPRGESGNEIDLSA